LYPNFIEALVYYTFQIAKFDLADGLYPNVFQFM